MWRFRFGDPVTSAVTSTVTASTAEVTSAGLEVLLDEWGGNKSAKWVGLTGGQQDRTRVWIDVQDATAPGGWKQVFSGALVKRPSVKSEWEAVGDKYLRLKELPVELENSGGGRAGNGIDVGAAVRTLGQGARADLPHLDVSKVADAGVLGKRDHNGESVAAALDGLLALKSGWGWTTLPNDTLYIGPPPARQAVVDASSVGNRVELRDVVSEGMRNAVRWVYRFPDGQPPAVHESRHASVGLRGRSSFTRFIDKRSLRAVTAALPATYYQQNTGEPEFTFVYEDLANRGDNNAYWPVGESTRLIVGAAAPWVEVEFRANTGVQLTVSGSVSYSQVFPAGPTRTLFLPAVQAGDEVRVTRLDKASQQEIALYEFTAVELLGSVLDTAAEDLYVIPAQHAGTASVPGLQPPAGTIHVQGATPVPFGERLVGTRYRITDPPRTEYLIGEPDEPADNLALKVLIDRRDENAVDQAVNTGGGG